MPASMKGAARSGKMPRNTQAAVQVSGCFAFFFPISSSISASSDSARAAFFVFAAKNRASACRFHRL